MLCAILLAGCISVETTIKLNRDGSGQIIEKIGMGKETVNMLSSMGGEGQGEKPFSKAEFEKDATKLGKGVKFVSVKESEDERMKYFEVVYAFEDINKVSIDQNQGNAVPSPESPKKEEPVRFEFKAEEDSSTLKIRMPEPDEDEFSKSESEEMETPPGMEGMEEAGLEMMKMMFKGMHFAITVVCNGEIVDTNATNVDGNTITLIDMDFDKMLGNPETLKELNAMKPEGIEEVKELLKDVEGLKFEMQEEVRVEFE
jgi:hypothetical protein